MTLKEARIHKNISQAQLSQSSGITIATISRIESGIHLPQRDTVRRIEKLIGPVDWTSTRELGRLRSQHPGIIIETQQLNLNTMDDKLMNPGQVSRPEPVKLQTQQKPKRQKIWASSTMSKAEMEAHNAAIDAENEEDDREQEVLLPPMKHKQKV